MRCPSTLSSHPETEVAMVVEVEVVPSGSTLGLVVLEV
jgi:hypothetical protein